MGAIFVSHFQTSVSPVDSDRHVSIRSLLIFQLGDIFENSQEFRGLTERAIITIDVTLDPIAY